MSYKNYRAALKQSAPPFIPHLWVTASSQATSLNRPNIVRIFRSHQGTGAEGSHVCWGGESRLFRQPHQFFQIFDVIWCDLASSGFAERGLHFPHSSRTLFLLKGAYQFPRIHIVWNLFCAWAKRMRQILRIIIISSFSAKNLVLGFVKLLFNKYSAFSVLAPEQKKKINERERERSKIGRGRDSRDRFERARAAEIERARAWISRREGVHLHYLS